MLNRAILVVCDGLGDRPVPQLGGLTPLEAAPTPNLDELAAGGESGMMHTLGRGFVPGSDVAHLAIMGYDPNVYYSGRGPIEAAGIGLELKDGDVALRGNFGTVDDNLMITDRRAGRIRDVAPLTEAIDGLQVDDVTMIVRPGTAHRAGVLLRGKGLSSAIVDADPHEVGQPVRTVVPTDSTPEAKHTAESLNALLLKAHDVLKKHPLNAQRIKDGNLPANFLLVRGAGQYKALPSFKDRYGFTACCIAGGGLYKGIGAFLGMKILNVAGATGLPDTDIEAKFRAGLEALNSYDFVFIHVKAADSLGEDGNHEGKRDFIARIDAATRLLKEKPADTLLVFTADHSTPCIAKHHSGDPVPVLFHGAGVRVDKVTAYNERACASGSAGFMTGLDIVPQIQNLLDRLPLTGA